MSQKYSSEFKARALELIEERVRAEQCSGWVACTAVGEAHGGISPRTQRNWWKQAASTTVKPSFLGAQLL